MLFRRPKKLRYATLAHTIPLLALDMWMHSFCILKQMWMLLCIFCHFTTPLAQNLAAVVTVPITEGGRPNQVINSNKFEQSETSLCHLWIHQNNASILLPTSCMKFGHLLPTATMWANRTHNLDRTEPGTKLWLTCASSKLSQQTALCLLVTSSLLSLFTGT